MSVGGANGTFTCMRDLPLDVQYYFLRTLSHDTQMFAAMACREWYGMLRKYIHVDLHNIIEHGEPWQLMYLLPKIRRNEYLTVYTILLVCKHNKTDMMTMLHVANLKVTCLKNKYIHPISGFGTISIQSEPCHTPTTTDQCPRTCPMHDAAVCAIRNSNSEMLRLLGDLCSHIYEKMPCTWTKHGGIYIAYDNTMMHDIIDSQAISILNNAITKPFIARYKIQTLIDYAIQQQKHVSHLYLTNYKIAHG